MTSTKRLTPPIVAILVGGLGTRLRPLISSVPKPLALIAGEPFLFLLLRTLSQYGIKRVVLLTGYMHDKIVNACGDGNAFNLDIYYSEERTQLGTAGALANAAHYLRSHEEFIVLNGDTYLKAPLDGFIQHRLRPHSYGTVGVINNHEFDRYGSIQFDDNKTIHAFHEKQAQSTGWINAGIYKFSSTLFDMIPSDRPCSLERDIFPTIITNFKENGLDAYLLEGSLHDIGTPESYLSFNDERMK